LIDFYVYGHGQPRRSCRITPRAPNARVLSLTVFGECSHLPPFPSSRPRTAYTTRLRSRTTASTGTSLCSSIPSPAQARPCATLSSLPFTGAMSSPFGRYAHRRLPRAPHFRMLSSSACCDSRALQVVHTHLAPQVTGLAHRTCSRVAARRQKGCANAPLVTAPPFVLRV